MEPQSPSLTARVFRPLVFLRGWFRPDLQITSSPGQVSVERARLPVSDHSESVAPLGSWLATSWARHWRAGRQHLKIEIFAGDYQAAEDTVRRRDHVDVITSVGVSVRPGRYVAVHELNAIQVLVTPRATASG